MALLHIILPVLLVSLGRGRTGSLKKFCVVSFVMCRFGGSCGKQCGNFLSSFISNKRQLSRES